MKPSDIRAMTDSELTEALTQARDEYFRMTLQHHTGQLGNTAQLVGSRRTIARLMTVQRERAGIAS